MKPACNLTRVFKHALMKPALSQPVSSEKRPTVSHFYSKEMPFHRPASGF